MNFECKCCVFATDKKSTWKKHLRSKSHKHKICENKLLLQQIAMKQQEKKDLLAIFQKNKLTPKAMQFLLWRNPEIYKNKNYGSQP